MRSMYWLLALVMGVAATGTAFGDQAPANDAGGQHPGTVFFPVESPRGTVRVEREILGVVLQDFRLVSLRSRQGMREYRLTLRLRNAIRRPVTPSLRVLLWSKDKPEVAFDIRGGGGQVSIQPKRVIRFRGSFKLDDKTRLTRLTAMPLPPHRSVVRLDEPVTLPAQPPGQEPAGAGSRPQAGEGSAPLTDAERQKQQDLSRFGDEVRRTYLQQQEIPQANAMGRLAGIGPYGPQYRVLEGPFRGIYVQAPSGWVPGNWLPSSVEPRDMWVDAFR